MKVRAIIDGEVVVGRYVPTKDKHWVILQGAEVYYDDRGNACVTPQHIVEIPDIALCAEDTGKDDKNGKRIFGSRPPEMQGGDRVRVTDRSGVYKDELFDVIFDDDDISWKIRGPNEYCDLNCWEPADLEIVPRKEADSN